MYAKKGSIDQSHAHEFCLVDCASSAIDYLHAINIKSIEIANRQHFTMWKCAIKWHRFWQTLTPSHFAQTMLPLMTFMRFSNFPKWLILFDGHGDFQSIFWYIRKKHVHWIVWSFWHNNVYFVEWFSAIQWLLEKFWTISV